MPAIRRVAGVLLAAGASQRMGRPKQLLELDGEPLVRRAARAALASRCEALYLVVGNAASEVAAAVAGLELECVENHQYADGLSASIRVGVRAVEAASGFDAVLLMLVDQPRIDAATFDRLIDAWDGTPAGSAACRYAGEAGVPALFGKASFAALCGLRGDRGARALLRTQRPPPQLVACPEAETDIDTPADYESYSK